MKKDLLDAYQARLVDELEESAVADERGFRSPPGGGGRDRRRLLRDPGRRVHRAAGRRRRPPGRGPRSQPWRGRRRAAAAGPAFAAALADARQALDGFTAAPFTPAEQARRAQQLIRFLDLVPIEYRDGTDDGKVTIPFEIQEAIAFRDGAEAAFGDLEAALERDRSARHRGAPSASSSG